VECACAWFFEACGGAVGLGDFAETGIRAQTEVPIRYVLVLWLMVLSTVAYLDRTNISVAGIEMCQEFAISKIRLGWVFSAFLGGMRSFRFRRACWRGGSDRAGC
jgi:hypothetical protein